MTIDQYLLLAQHLAWPTIGLIALFVLRPILKELPQLAMNIKWLATNTEKIEGLVNQLATAAANMKDLKGVQEELLDKVAMLQGQQEVLGNIGDNTQINSTTNPSDDELEQLWAIIKSGWEDTKSIIAHIAKSTRVQPIFIGTVGVTKTVDALIDENALTKDAARMIKDLSARWQWMFRTSKPKKEWLTEQVALQFKNDVTDVAKALLI